MTLKLKRKYFQERFHGCKDKLSSFTSPQAAFETRLNRAVGELRNVERNSCILDVQSAGPSNVQDQCQHCVVRFSLSFCVLEFSILFYSRKCTERCRKSNQKSRQ